MSVKIENVEMKLMFPDNNVIKLPSTLVNKAFSFFLTDIKNGDDIIVEFDKPKQMVPSFEKAKSDSVLILQYSNAKPEVPATVSLVLELDLDESTVKMTGFGFTTATLSVEIEEFPTQSEVETSLREDVAANSVLNVNLSDEDNAKESVAAIREEYHSTDENGEDLGK